MTAQLVLSLLVGLILLVGWLGWRALVWWGGLLQWLAERRDRARWAEEQRWVDAGALPLSHSDVYASEWEMTQDLSRLKAMGYAVEWQRDTEDGLHVTYVLAAAYERSTAPVV